MLFHLCSKALPALLLHLTDRIETSHIHCHVISTDLVSPFLKVKKHYNSFHPKLGFFLHMDEVLSWFDAEPSFFDTVRIILLSVITQM